MKKIKIAVACHKPSIVPKNSLFVPIQVGAARASSRMKGMYYDDEGINISDKNPMYCELTAQYWLWKNVEADYYGLCHYRRFLCFANVKAKKNVRDQFIPFAITPHNIQKYGLENETEMRAIIENNDAIVGLEQDVAKLPTSRGNKDTAYDHWAAYNRYFVMVDHIETMLNILAEVSPAIGKDAREYLNGDTFLGFNTFVLKRELFYEMCDIEFEVLRRLEEKLDLTHCNQLIKRVYGYMGEIIFSSYIYHIEKNKKYKVKHLPLVHFDYTDDLPDYGPLNEENTIPVLFNFCGNEEYKFAPEWQSFLDTCDNNYFYDVLLVMDKPSETIKNVYLGMAKAMPNISLRFIDGAYVRNILKDEYNNDIYIDLIIPFFLKDYNRMLVFGPKLLFRKPVVEMWQTFLPKNKIVAAPKDIYMLARINDLYYETEEKYLSTQLKNVYNYFTFDTMLINLEAYRKHINLDTLFNLRINENNKLRRLSDIYNIIFEDKVLKLNQKWNVLYATSNYLKKQLSYAPNDDYCSLLNVQKDPYVISYIEKELFLGEISEAKLIYWENAKKTPVYELLLEYVNCLRLKKILIDNLSRETALKNSISFRIGRAITWGPRKIRNGINCYKENGFIYTAKRVFWHITHFK